MTHFRQTIDNQINTNKGLNLYNTSEIPSYISPELLLIPESDKQADELVEYATNKVIEEFLDTSTFSIKRNNISNYKSVSIRRLK